MRIAFFIFILYSFVFHWYPYFYEWETPDQPTAPTYILISRDILFLLTFFVFLISKSISEIKLGYSEKTLSMLIVFDYSLLLIVMLLGAIHTSLFEFTQHNARNLMIYILIIPIYFYVCQISKTNPASILAKIFVWMGILLSVFGIITYLFMDKFYLWGGVRVFSLMGNPNTFGVFLLIPSLIVWYMLLQKSEYKKKLYLGLTLLLFTTALVLTLSFQSYISFVMALLLMAFYFRNYRAFFTALGFFTILIVILFFTEEYLDVIITTWYFKLESPISTSYTGRIEQFYYVLEEFKNVENWLAGVLSLEEYKTFDNQYYNIFINNGLFALVLYVTPPFLTTYLGFKKFKHLKGHIDIWHQSIYYSGLFFIIIVMIITANLTAFMQRFPVNMYFYLILSIILYSICIGGNKSMTNTINNLGEKKIQNY